MVEMVEIRTLRTSRTINVSHDDQASYLLCILDQAKQEFAKTTLVLCIVLATSVSSHPRSVFSVASYYYTSYVNANVRW